MTIENTHLNDPLQIYDLTALKINDMLAITKSKLHRPFSKQSESII